MTVGGWIFLVLGWGTVIGLVIFCMKKVFEKGTGFD
jgi:hypothetical protein